MVLPLNGQEPAPVIGQPEVLLWQSVFVSLTAPGLVAAAFSEHGVEQPLLVSLTAPGLAAADLSLQQADFVSDTAPGLAAATLSLHAAVVHLLLSVEHAPSVLQDLPPQQPLTAPGAVVGVL
ncbi:MAG: hypothetical protein EBT49_09920 [Betaproteobacteria bacterium]|nr:hypothetical protein [Betaproteobacteria bacterium]